MTYDFSEEAEMTNEQLRSREDGLEVIASTIQQWIDWNKDSGNVLNGRDSHVMRVPVWPTIGVLENWVKVLRKEATT